MRLRSASVHLVLGAHFILLGCHAEKQPRERRPDAGGDAGRHAEGDSGEGDSDSGAPVVEPCRAEEQGSGSTLITCGDGRSVELVSVGDHQACDLTSVGDGNWTLSCDDGFVQTAAEASATELIFSDQNASLWWAAVKPGGTVVKVPVVELTEPYTITRYRLSPDGAYLVYEAAPRRDCDGQPITTDPKHIRIAPLRGEEVPAPSIDLPSGLKDAWFAPNSRALLFTERAPGKDRRQSALKLVRLPPIDGAVTIEEVSGCIGAPNIGGPSTHSTYPHGSVYAQPLDGRWMFFTTCATEAAPARLMALDLNAPALDRALHVITEHIGEWWANRSYEFVYYASERPESGELEFHVAVPGVDGVQTRHLLTAAANELIAIDDQNVDGTQILLSIRGTNYYFDARSPDSKPLALGTSFGSDAVFFPARDRFCVIDGGKSDALRCANLTMSSLSPLRTLYETVPSSQRRLTASADNGPIAPTSDGLLVAEVYLEGSSSGTLRFNEALFAVDLNANRVQAIAKVDPNVGIGHFKLDLAGTTRGGRVALRIDEELVVLDATRRFKKLSGISAPARLDGDPRYATIANEVWIAQKNAFFGRVWLDAMGHTETVAEKPGEVFAAAPHGHHLFVFDSIPDALRLVDRTGPMALISDLSPPSVDVRDALYTEDGHKVLWNAQRARPKAKAGGGELRFVHVGNGSAGTSVLIHEEVIDFALRSRASGKDWIAPRNPEERYPCW